MTGLRFREATFEDCALIFAWANDPATRANSARTDMIEWDGHVGWFREKLADPNAEIWIVTDEDGEPVGQVRFDRDAGDDARAEIGVMVDAERRGGGIGTRIIEAATVDYVARHPGATVVAYIRHHNIPSQRAFTRAGYIPDGEGSVRGVMMLRYLWSGSDSSPPSPSPSSHRG